MRYQITFYNILLHRIQRQNGEHLKTIFRSFNENALKNLFLITARKLLKYVNMNENFTNKQKKNKNGIKMTLSITDESEPP